MQGKWVAPAPAAPAPAGPVAASDTPIHSNGDAGGKASSKSAEVAGVAVRAGPTAAAPAPAGSSNGAGGSSNGRPRTPMPVMLAAMGVSFFISGVMHEICIA